MPSKEELAKLTVAELRAQLKDAGLPTTGKKEELVERLLEVKAKADEEETAPSESAPAPVEAEAAEAPASTEVVDIPAVDGAAKDAEPTVATEEVPGKRPKIVFTETAIKTAPQKIVVVKPVEAEKPPSKTETQRLKERADRFKDPDVLKAKSRAERFGVPHPELDKEKAMKRAERFGTFHPEIEAEKKKTRAERFGVDDPETKAKARADRFKPLVGTPKVTMVSTAADADFETLKKARAARFAAADADAAK